MVQLDFLSTLTLLPGILVQLWLLPKGTDFYLGLYSAIMYPIKSKTSM
jgi:hypothetical protein